MEIELYLAIGFSILGVAGAVYKSIESRGEKSIGLAVINGLENAFYALDPDDVNVIKSEIKGAAKYFDAAEKLDTRVHEERAKRERIEREGGA